ncbi:MAG: hypothetical protein COZ91_03120 [Candidatus Nealsonbacteria bacterium CG_4_8_14_3_um_filter_39_7]|uniref:PilN domain-containing protein n=1 Tax=Candidatus Nealsonbacteria bacterium CG23_combo_of_CG06-09_8_20_14_all_39_17 TaxID=1974722 RepID=A0A2G9YV54_9BACT|nr:MAG: hypothetical protein COX37_02960 [Candidatus Nealsonbacteria bacterium CG23_combo_of_CG06-09_8_20_14_all_39_17]PIW90943.1 MAG: hypothetical protein COZ91_03120 [Candidatus Nealsonbacteria bacterium CG_4_8_14_3_um_filter_39_7]
MVEIIPKPAEKPPVWESALLYSSIVVLLTVIVGYLVLDFYFIKKASATLDGFKNSLIAQKTDSEIALEEKALDYKKKIEGFSQLMGSHVFASRFFPFLEKNTHPQVLFSDLELDMETGSVNLSGETESFLSLEQQVKILENNPQIKSLNLSGVSIGDKGKIKFAIDFSFDKGIVLGLANN